MPTASAMTSAVLFTTGIWLYRTRHGKQPPGLWITTVLAGLALWALVVVSLAPTP